MQVNISYYFTLVMPRPFEKCIVHRFFTRKLFMLWMLPSPNLKIGTSVQWQVQGGRQGARDAPLFGPISFNHAVFGKIVK